MLKTNDKPRNPTLLTPDQGEKMMQAYKIHKSNIVEAIEDMNRSSDFHRPSVHSVDKLDDEYYIVFVETNASYPCRENNWKELEGMT